MTDKTFTHDIIADYGIINERVDALGNKWIKRVRCISWNVQKPLIDIREWSADDTICRSGLRFSWREIDNLTDLLDKIREERQRDREAEAGVMAEASQSVPERVQPDLETEV